MICKICKTIIGLEEETYSPIGCNRCSGAYCSVCVALNTDTYWCPECGVVCEGCVSYHDDELAVYPWCLKCGNEVTEFESWVVEGYADH